MSTIQNYEVCEQEKHISNFSKSYKGRCKKCVAAQTKEKRKIQTIRDLIKKAEKKDSELSFAVQEVEKNLVYYGFAEDDLPNASMCAGGEFILVYHGKEIYVEYIIRCMEEQGYITPDDFLQISRRYRK